MDNNVQNDNKARLFEFIFGREKNKKWTLSLYNAVNGTHYDNVDDIEITTIENVIYMSGKNDVSFLINDDISLYEHQSSYNPNMPVRQLMYLGKLYDKHIKKTNQNLYSSKQMVLPVPKLITFYNGKDDKGDQILQLSDSFPKGRDPKESDVEVKVHMINIRPQYKSSILENCKPLSEYSWFVEEIRKNNETMEIGPSVDKAIDDMPIDYELKEFLIIHKAEVRNMSITEYNEEETMKLFAAEYLAEGREQTQRENVVRMLGRHKPIEDIAADLDVSVDYVKEIEAEVLAKV